MAPDTSARRSSGFVTGASLAMPLRPSFLSTKLLFLCVGMAFSLVKVSVYSTPGLIALMLLTMYFFTRAVGKIAAADLL